MNPKVSVIVPVYNAQHHIERCCRSLFGQTLDDLEIIFVNDCSSDDSVDIIKKVLLYYPQRINNTQIINQPVNLGVGTARFTGNKNAKGEYIIHCDSDDFASNDMYERMYITAKKNNADIVICDYKCGDHIVCLKTDPNNLTFDISPIEGAVWNKLIRRSLLEDYSITFSHDLILGEDFLYVTQSRLLAQKTVYLPLPLYNYTIDNNNSITRHFDERKCQSVVTVARRMENFIYEHNLFDKISLQLNYLKFQAKSFYLIFPETRDLRKYSILFPECELNVKTFPIAKYRKICSKLIGLNLFCLASIILKIKDSFNQ